MDNALIICSEGPFVAKLQTRFKPENILTSEAVLKEALPNVRDEVQSIVVLAELSWGGRRLSEFYGLEVVRRLRVEYRLHCPIIVCSFMPESFFLPDADDEEHAGWKATYNLLEAPGHTFRSLPFDFTKLNEHTGSPLSDILLDDILESLCDLEGLLNEIEHDLRQAVVLNSGQHSEPHYVRDKLQEAVDGAFGKIVRLFPNDPRVERIKTRLWSTLEDSAITKEQPELAIEIVEQFEGELRSLHPTTPGGDVRAVATEELPWKVLFIDDRENIRKRVVEELAKRNVRCEAVATAEEMFAKLDEDASANLFTVVIVDYRLRKPGSRKWQDMQGYEILEKVAFKPNSISLFALTAANRRALQRIIRAQQVKILDYSKVDVLNPHGFNIFAQRVLEEGQRTYEIVANQPHLTSWKKGYKSFKEPLKNYYEAHRNAVDYREAEEEIARKAKEYVKRVRAYRRGYRDQPFGFHGMKFRAGLPGGPEDSKAMRLFRIKLVGRRIALALYLLEDMGRHEIFHAMKPDPIPDAKDYFDDDEDKIEDKGTDNLLNTHLALSLPDDVERKRLLVEERAWLGHDLGIDLERRAQQKQAWDVVEEGLARFASFLKKKGFADTFLVRDHIQGEIEAEQYIQQALAVAGRLDRSHSKLRATAELMMRLQDALYDSIRTHQPHLGAVLRIYARTGIIESDLFPG